MAREGIVARPALAIVMPAYGEIENLRWLLPELRGVLDSCAAIRAYSILVVLPRHASADECAEVGALGAEAVIRSPGDSFGDAMRSGLVSVPEDVDLVITMDADGSHRPSTIPQLVHAATAGDADVVIASRYVAGGRSDNSIPLRLMSRSLNLAYAVILGINSRDLSTNFKLYRAGDVRSLSLDCANFDIVEEILFKVVRARGRSVRIVEIPDHFRGRSFGATKRRLGPFIVSYLGTLLSLRFSTTGPGAHRVKTRRLEGAKPGGSATGPGN